MGAAIDTHSFRVARQHNRLGLVRWPAGQALPELFCNERHDGVQQAQTVVEDSVQRVLSGTASFERRVGSGDILDRFL